jgi:hypothetical protein
VSTEGGGFRVDERQWKQPTLMAGKVGGATISIEYSATDYRIFLQRLTGAKLISCFNIGSS